MLIANLRTRVGLVNGALGNVIAAELREGAGSRGDELRSGVLCTDVKYVVVDFPSYTGPTFYVDHPTWVPIRPISLRHKRIKRWQRVQLPLVLAWGLAIHKS